MLVPVLMAVGAGVLLLGGVTVAAIFVVPMLFGGGASEDLYFMPDNTQMVGQVRADQILNSDALKQVWSAFPDAKKGFDKASSQTSGVDPNNVDRVYFGSSSANFTGTKTRPPPSRSCTSRTPSRWRTSRRASRRAARQRHVHDELLLSPTRRSANTR